MASPKRDQATVTSAGASLAKLPHGVSFRPTPTHVDERGILAEGLDPRWGWHKEPIVYSYVYTVRPGMTKGWAVHKEHEDRYFIVSGEARVVLYDERPDSPTKGLVAQVWMTEHQRGVMNIPAGIWHATQNVGATDVIMVNYPTKPYAHENPEKYRLPLDTDRIPFRFEGTRGW